MKEQVEKRSIVLLGATVQSVSEISKNSDGVTEQIETLDSSSLHHRQGLIPWWKQSVIRKAKVFVMGAGATGNETLKNLALLGVGNIFICDMDTIELTNLSRTLLFRRDDEGKLKAEVAAQRLKEMSTEPDFKVDYFCGDVMYELGTGVLRRFDIILGCLDNDATRFYIDRQCTILKKPWIDAGIAELNWNVQIINSHEGICFCCGESPERIAQVISRKASCGKTIISDLNAGKVPTVQVTSAFVSALQTQEAVKILHAQHDEKITAQWGRSYSFRGINNEYSKSKLLGDENCFHHEIQSLSEDDIIEFADTTNEITLRDFLMMLKNDGRFTDEFELDLSNEPGREFITQLYCIFCGKEIQMGMPRYKLKRKHTFCEECNEDMEESALICNTLKKFSLHNTQNEILDLSLKQIGIPKLHILMIVDKNDNVYYVELTGDLKNIFPNMMRDK